MSERPSLRHRADIYLSGAEGGPFVLGRQVFWLRKKNQRRLLRAGRRLRESSPCWQNDGKISF